jgi:hypothetical protein
MIRTLPELLSHAGISATAYWMGLWFAGCSLDRNQLLCPDLATAERVERLFLPQLREAMSDLEIRVAGTGEKPMNSWRPVKKAIFNKRPEPTDQDML